MSTISARGAPIATLTHRRSCRCSPTMTHEEIEEIRERLTTRCGLGTFEHHKDGLGSSLFRAEHPSHPRLQIRWFKLDIGEGDDLAAAIEQAIEFLTDGGGDVVIQWSGSRLVAVRKEIEPPFSPP